MAHVAAKTQDVVVKENNFDGISGLALKDRAEIDDTDLSLLSKPFKIQCIV